jgi:anti-sigma regulatory factor (Ser/Thr protein kinase)
VGVVAGMAAGSETLDLTRRGVPRAPRARAFQHELTFYGDGAHGFTEETLPFVRRALHAEEPVLVQVTTRRAEALAEALGPDAARVSFVDVASLGRNPARLIPAWQAFVDAHGGAGSGLGICEPAWLGRSAAELGECERHEALLNVVFADGPGWQLLCTYDLDGLDDRVLESAQRTHPYRAHAGVCHANGLCARSAPNALAGLLPPPAIPFVEQSFGLPELGKVRRVATAWATGQGLGGEQTEDLVLAVNELAGNSVRYAGGRGRLRMWREDDSVVCEISDRGAICDQLVGRVQPEAYALGGRGIWIVNQVCDLVQIRSSRSGSVVRVHKRCG